MSGFLSDEILAEIFSRLPFRSLLRLRCLSKSCRRLISDYRLPCGLLSNTDVTHLQFAGIQPKSQPSLDDPQALPFPLPPRLPIISYPRLFLHDCCNGFLLVDHYLRLYVGNPATSNWAPVPERVWPKRPTALASAMALAMFSDIHDYNVVLVPSPTTSSLDLFESETGEWREVDEIAGLERVYFEHCRLALCPWNSKIYVTDVHNDRTFEIDVIQKVCLEIMEREALPVGSCLRFGQEAHWLGMSQGRLHQVVVLNNKMFVWVLDDGASGGGAKSFVLKHRARLAAISRRFDGGRGPKCVFVLGFHPESDVVYLRVNGDMLVSYDFSRGGGGMLEEIGTKRVDGNTFFYSAVYGIN